MADFRRAEIFREGGRRRSNSEPDEARAVALQKDAEKIKVADQTRRETSERALRVYDLLGSEKEGPGLNQAMTQAQTAAAVDWYREALNAFATSA